MCSKREREREREKGKWMADQKEGKGYEGKKGTTEKVVSVLLVGLFDLVFITKKKKSKRKRKRKRKRKQ